MRRRLLVAHFLRRFLDNDLISPQADRHQVLAVACAALLTSSTFLAVLMSIKYLFRPLQSRGWTLVAALGDTFLWSGLSMIVMAVVALASWDALSLDARDTEILGPLPVPRRSVVTAQLAAVGLFAAAFAVALNGIPSVVAPLVRFSRLPITGSRVLGFIAVHAVVTASSGLFGFAAVVALREGLRATLGARWFTRVAAPAQGLLVVLLATSFLLLPLLAANSQRQWLSSNRVAGLPPLWFVGLHETLLGDVLDHVPPTPIPDAAPSRARMLAYEARMARLYQERVPVFSELARLALEALGMTLMLAGVAWAWNNRRLPELTALRPTRRSGPRDAFVALLYRMLLRRPLTRAGFAFTLQTCTRSTPHRVAIAATLGVALSVLAVGVQGISIARGQGNAPVSTVSFALQTCVLLVLVGGFRYATRVPADLRGSTTFVLARGGNDRLFVEGVKWAGALALGCPAIVLLLPLHAMLMDPRMALAHAACGVLILLVFIELLFLRGRGVPFVSAYQPAANVMALGSIIVAVALAGIWSLASTERIALADAKGTAALALGLIVAGAALRALNARGVADSGVLDPEGAPAGITQPLALND